MTLFFLTFGIFLLAFVLLGIRMLIIPGAEFRKTCSGGVLDHEGGVCAHCGRTADNYCDSHQRRLRRAKEQD